MNWIILSLLAPLLYTCVVFIDKYVVEHKVKNSRGMPIYGAIAAIIFGTGVWLICGAPNPGVHNGLLLLLSGFISMQGYALYFYSLSKSQTSYIIALLQTTPIFTLLLSLMVLREGLTIVQFGGFLVFFAAVLGLSIDRVECKLKLGLPFIAIMTANLLFAIAAIVIKFTTSIEHNFASIVAYESWGIALGGILLFGVFGRVRHAFLKSFSSVGKPTLGTMFFNESLFILSKALTFLAVSLGPVALVGMLGGVQLFYGFIFGALLTIAFPSIFHEDLRRFELIKNGIFSVVMFVGIWLVSLT